MAAVADLEGIPGWGLGKWCGEQLACSHDQRGGSHVTALVRCAQLGGEVAILSRPEHHAVRIGQSVTPSYPVPVHLS